MARNKPVWGIDLGQCALKAICLQAAGDKVEAVDYAYIEHGKILSQPGVERAELIAETMKKFLEKHDLSRATIVVGVPGQNTLARFTKLPPVDKKKIPEIVKYEAQQQIPFDMEEVIWDYQTFENPEAMETEVGIFAMRRGLLRDHLKFLSDFRLEPSVVQSSPLALYNALRYDGLIGGEPVAILDIGAENTDLLAVDGNSLWTRNIPIGGNRFTEALLHTFKLSFNKAENLKRSAGSSKYARQVFQAMRPVFADLVAEIQRSVGFYTSSRRGVKLDKLIAMGNAFKLPGMPKFIQQNLGMEVVRPTMFNRLSASGAPNAPQLVDQLLSFGVAYGLALQGLDLAPITSSLLPPEIAKQVIWQKKTPWFYGAAACLALSAVLIWGRNMSDSSAVAAGVGDGGGGSVGDVSRAVRIIENGPPGTLAPKPYAEEVLQAVQVLNDEKSRLESEIQQQVAQAQAIKGLQSNKPVWPKILNMIHSALPSPESELARAMADGPQAYKALIAGNPAKYERAKRKQVFIREFKAEYSEDVSATIDQKMSANPGTPSPGPLGASAAPTSGQDGVKKGFVLALVCRTPFSGGNLDGLLPFIQNVFVANLYRAGQKEKSVYLDEVRYLGSPVSVRDPGGSGGGIRGGRAVSSGMGSVGAASAAKAEELRDPVTGELMSKDWQFQLLVSVVVGDRPAAQLGEEPGVAAPPPQ
ncbi:MAG TPA: type IV pilus assembly protein PilM [Phycisphaerae bacterium]|nr:type IV pilus assembly protein PilM [Phycisphaerae bacterium]